MKYGQSCAECGKVEVVYSTLCANCSEAPLSLCSEISLGCASQDSVNSSRRYCSTHKNISFELPPQLRPLSYMPNFQLITGVEG